MNIPVPMSTLVAWTSLYMRLLLEEPKLEEDDHQFLRTSKSMCKIFMVFMLVEGLRDNYQEWMMGHVQEKLDMVDQLIDMYKLEDPFITIDFSLSDVMMIGSMLPDSLKSDSSSRELEDRFYKVWFLVLTELLCDDEYDIHNMILRMGQEIKEKLPTRAKVSHAEEKEPVLQIFRDLREKLLRIPVES